MWSSGVWGMRSRESQLWGLSLRVCKSCLLVDAVSKTRVVNVSIVFLGESGCGGKTSLILRYLKNEFRDNYEATTGAAYYSTTKKTSENSLTRFEMWDVSGQERFECLADMYYRGARVCVVSYDISSRTSFVRAQRWLETLKMKLQPSAAGECPTVVLVGNKMDLEYRKVKTAEGQLLANDFNVKIFMEVSAKTGQNVEELFDMIGMDLSCGPNFFVSLASFEHKIPTCFLSQTLLGTMLSPLLHIILEYVGQMQWSLWNYNIQNFKLQSH